MSLENIKGLEKFGKVSLTRKGEDFVAKIKFDSSCDRTAAADVVKHVFSQEGISISNASYNEDENSMVIKYNFSKEATNKDRGSTGCGLDEMPYFTG